MAKKTKEFTNRLFSAFEQLNEIKFHAHSCAPRTDTSNTQLSTDQTSQKPFKPNAECA